MRIACKQIFLLIAFLLLFKSFVCGQPRCKIEYYSTEQGLSHQRVTTILKDKEGFMWFGTWDGINRFDGHSFISYKSSPGDLSQLSNDRIDQIVEDQSGHLWIQSYDKQVYRFDKKTGQFLPLSSIINLSGKSKLAFANILPATNGFVWLQSLNEGIFCVPQNGPAGGHFQQFRKEQIADFRLPSNTINFFHEDAEHRLWIGTTEGLSCLVKSANGVYKNNNLIPKSVASTMNVLATDEDSSKVYFSTADGDLVSFDKSSRSFSVQKISYGHLNAFLCSKKSDFLYFTTSVGDLILFDRRNQQTTKITYRPNESLGTVYEDSKGDIWIEPETTGAIRFNPANQTFRYFSPTVNEGRNNIGGHLRIIEDNNHTVWVNMKGGGFGFYDEARDSLDYILSTPEATTYRLPALVPIIYYDPAGILWLSTYEKELVKLILQGSGFTQQIFAAPGFSVSNNEVRGIFYDKQHRLWSGVKNGKLYVYQNNQPLSGLFDNEPADGLGLVYVILQDRQGNIWLGTKGNGLYKASPLNKEGTRYHLSHFQADAANSNTLSGKDIYALLEDRQGRIWVGTFDNGLNLVQPDGDSIKFIHDGTMFSQYPKGAFHRIRHMATDASGTIWIGTTDGLLLLNTNSKQSGSYQFKTYSKLPGDKESLGNSDVQFIYRDSKNRMWLGTSGGGFCQALGDNPFQSLRFRNYTTKDGLPNDYVLSCAEDSQGNLWIATENGLSKFNPESRTFRNYDSFDGLPKLAFSEAAACHRLPDGRLVFGTTKGALSFDPAQINATRISANIALTNLQINNEDARPGTADSVLKTDINYISELTLEYNQNIISIDYAILDYRAGNRQEFAYRLVGFDTIWHNDRQFRRATYTNLPPGHYVFEVKSLSTDLYSNQPYRRLAVTILPPPWKTWWAYLLYAVLLGVLLYFIRLNALAMIRLRNKIAVEQKLAALKLAFFTNVSHELRTPLTLIVNPLEQLAKKEKLSPEGTAIVDVARKNAGRMVRFINQLLDLRKVQSEKATLQISRVEIVTFVKKIADHFNEAARSKRIKLEIISNQKELQAWVDAEKLDVVVYNLLGNAVKFTPEGKTIRIFIRTLPEERDFSIAVYDQGPGVPSEKLEEIFELFQEGEHAQGRELKGTGIGLALSREFVNLHGGTIWAENNEDGGLTVTIRMKLGSEHYNQAQVSFVDKPKSSPVFEKPIEQQLLQQPLSTTVPKDSQAPLVLLVEDNDELRSFIRAQLGEFYRVETAKDGEEGLQKAVNLIPDLIVSDIMMPKMDGIQMLDKVKNEVNTSHVPVVLLSAKYSIESQIEGLKYGADCYITKPFNNEFLIASINNLLRQRKKLFEALVEKKKTITLSPEPVVITSKDEIFLKEVIKVVEEKMADFDFNIDTVAESIAMSRTTFYKKFKSLTGMAPVEFVRDMRLQRARQLLDAGGSNISEVAYTVGFNSPKYFSTCFKEKYHVSPSEYVKLNAE
jgi:signal transduction histidine kinase/ligand-binding sensor domain-containing protein/CheY-like chemotaxis protein/AraC-like DNA-binding protein